MAFSGCSALTSVTLPASLKSIGESAFDRCYNISEVLIEEGVESIASYCFSGCTGINKVTCNGVVPPTGDTTAFASGVYTNATLVVPDASLDAYKSTSPWSMFTYFANVEDIIANCDAPAVYYNLQGLKVENPENGIFIRVQGGKSSKVFVK